jgi:sugar phosphate isomerase/epimerase
MFLTGFADEAGASVETQIAATKELGWKYIESRAIGQKNLASLTDAEFEDFAEKLDRAGLKVNCYGSAVANWSRDPRSDADFEASRKELLSALPRMAKLGVKMIRGMSFKVPADAVPDSPELEAVIFRKVRELVKLCEEAGVIYGHENCMNYGGMSYIHTLRLIESVKSPNFRLIFDTGNPVFTFRRIGPAPWPLQSAWEFHKNVREFIDYVHIKDGVSNVGPDGKVQTTFTFAGDGCGHVRAIVRDLLATGYDGGFSMEPHLAVIFHEKDNTNDDAVKALRKKETYVEYGRRFEKLLAECGWTGLQSSPGV